MQSREYLDVPVEANWMPVPKFGDWDNLTDPDYEAPETDRPESVTPS